MKLTEKVYNKICELCVEGDQFAEAFFFDKAIEKYLETLSLIPDPKINWEASTWVYTALGDSYYHKRDFANAKQFLYDALNCPEAIGNPFIYLRLGETLAELSEIEKAKEYLLRAYMIEGYSIFREEDDNYYNIIKNEI